MEDCENCYGRGYFTEDKDGVSYLFWENCDSCNGSGKQVPDEVIIILQSLKDKGYSSEQIVEAYKEFCK